MTEELKQLTRIIANTTYPAQGSALIKPINKFHLTNKKNGNNRKTNRSNAGAIGRK